jgi:hypothetical protein
VRSGSSIVAIVLRFLHERAKGRDGLARRRPTGQHRRHNPPAAHHLGQHRIGQHLALRQHPDHRPTNPMSRCDCRGDVTAKRGGVRLTSKSALNSVWGGLRCAAQARAGTAALIVLSQKISVDSC